MGVFVEVLYSDLSRRREKLEDIAKLPKDDVLFIRAFTTEEKGKLKNIAAGFGRDHYAVCQRRCDSQDWVMISGWDDDDFVWRRLKNVHGPGAKKQVDIPLECMNVIFRGGSVSEEKWKQAQKMIDKEMV